MNDHPLQSNLTELSNDELDKRYNDLSRRWQLAKRMNMDSYVLHQLDVMLTSMEAEKERRMLLLSPDDGQSVVLETDPISPKDPKK